ncbi:CHC2 zinc finger domain-containing protein [Akkermansiaceae bacterium]|nr:CHC2 zinc finger domain-containing protein [Akkermansiaceae bacterium]MDB4792308.1 CHC2 zinc finger domain-containing protein [bacterium]
MNDQKQRNHFDTAEIKERLTVWGVLRHFGYEVADGSVKALCPIHGEKTPSFSISKDGRLYKCFGCGAAGDVITLWGELSGCDKHAAIVECGKLAGLQAGEIPSGLSVPPPPRSQFNRDKQQSSSFRDKIGPYTEEVRGQMIDQALRFLSEGNNVLTEFCSYKDIELEFMKYLVESNMVGVLKHPALRQPAIGWLYDNHSYGKACKLRFDASSSKMTMWWEGKSAQHFFGEQLVPPVKIGSERPRIMVVEGESDCITMLQLGIPALGVPGSKVLPEPRITHGYLAYRNVGVWYDADTAGREATTKMQQHVIAHASGVESFSGIGSKVPDGMDIGECWSKWGDRFKKYAEAELDRMEISNKSTTLD